MNTPTDPRPEPPADASVQRLQRTVRGLWCATLLSLLIALLALSHSLDPRLRKRELVLTDGRGGAQIVIGAREQDAFLSIFDADGKARVAVNLGPNGPSIRLSDAGDGQHAGLSVQPDGARLALVHGQGAGLQLHADHHHARLDFQDAQAWPRLGVGIDDGMPYLGLLDTNLQARLVLGVDETGGKLSFFDDAQVRRLSLGVFENRPFLNPVEHPAPDGEDP